MISTRTLHRIAGVTAFLALMALSLALYGGREATAMDYLKMALFGLFLAHGIWDHVRGQA